MSLLSVANHPEIASGLVVLWISGGVFGLMSLANVYCSPSLRAAIMGDMKDVADLTDWAEVIRRNPGNRQRILDQDRSTFMRTMERWMAAYYPKSGEAVPGLSEDLTRSITVPALVFRSGESDWWHPRVTSEAVAGLLPDSRLVEPPWPDTEWIDGSTRRAHGNQQGAFERWPLLAPQILQWTEETQS